MLHFVYSLINFAILALILWLFARKMIARIFTGRKDRIDRALDEAERIESEEFTLPTLPETFREDLPAPVEAEIREIRETAAEHARHMLQQTEETIEDLRREMLLDVKSRYIDRLVEKAQTLMTTDTWLAAFRAREEEFTDRILEHTRLTPGDMAYLKRHDVLYVTLTSAYPMPQSIVDRIGAHAQKLLDEVGGKPSYWVRVDPELIAGFRFRIGDTVYDFTLADRLYQLRSHLESRDLQGNEDAAELLDGMFEDIRGMHMSLSQFQLGRVISISDGICWLDGLADIMYGEVIEFECGEQGMVLDIEPDRIGCIVYGRYEHIESGSRVRRVGRIASVPVGDDLLGRIVDPLGQALDGKGRIWTSEHRPIEHKAPAIPDRAAVSRPLHTGIKAIDALVPIGRGQRELIIGDRQTGKTSIALDAIINQKGTGTICIYVAIGQKDTTIADIRDKLTRYGAMSYTTIVCAPASVSASIQYIAPFAGAAMAEYFMYQGRDVLIVYDDLSKHAVAYRELSLLLHRPSGREAYPGDVFYLHARLLERAAQLSPENGGGSITALPIIETQAGDISAYIPTNVISITDGQIFLDADLFNEGQRPAVNVGLSVSRVGSAAQTKLMKQVSGRLRMDLAQYRELAGFTQFGSDIDASTRKVLDAGKRMMAALHQSRYAPLPDWEQVLLLFAVSEGYAAGVDPSAMDSYAMHLTGSMEIRYPALTALLRSGDKLSDKDKDALREAIAACGTGSEVA
ncbi:MAG: F0F1 ATP synthase subunit alpha [Ruminococcaceae bacterium]|nr:F0F1 ATP synthase subunit alpha [Oscillospiraceae bacterium]